MAKKTNIKTKVIKVHEHPDKAKTKSQFDIWIDNCHVDVNNIEGHVSINNATISDFDEISKQIKKYKL